MFMQQAMSNMPGMAAQGLGIGVLPTCAQTTSTSNSTSQYTADAWNNPNGPVDFLEKQRQQMRM